MRALRRLLRAERGAIAVEFAALAPVLAILIIGGFEVTRFVIALQKVDRIASSLADYVAQSKQVSSADLNNLFDAAAQIAKPLSFNDGVVIISSIYRQGADNAAQVVWQRSGGGGLTGASSQLGTQGTAATLPAGITLVAMEGMVAAEAFLDFTPLMMPDLIPAMRIHRLAFYRPRMSQQVAFSG